MGRLQDAVTAHMAPIKAKAHEQRIMNAIAKRGGWKEVRSSSVFDGYERVVFLEARGHYDKEWRELGHMSIDPREIALHPAVTIHNMVAERVHKIVPEWPRHKLIKDASRGLAVIS